MICVLCKSPVSCYTLLMENILEFKVWEKDGRFTTTAVSVKKVGLARSCSRDIQGVRAFLDKKRAEGYAAHGNPTICRKSRYLVTNEDVIEVQGPQTSGEVEIAAIMDKGAVLISVGSDHNDRSVGINIWSDALGRVYDSAKSKQMVPAVVARDAWRYEHVRDHWDDLHLKSYVTVSGARIPYQDFRLRDLVDLEYHFRSEPWIKEDGVVLLGGSTGILPSVPSNVYQFQPSLEGLPGLIFPPDFHFEVHDPVLNRTISHSYRIMAIEEPGSLSL